MNKPTTVLFDEIYQNTLKNAVLLQHPNPAILRLKGPGAMDLLNRMSTNDMLASGTDEVLKTVFTNTNARIIDIASVIPGDEEFFLISWRDSASILLDWLSGYIFFQDDVHLRESTNDWTMFDFIGPNAEHGLKETAPFEDYPGHGFYRVENGYIWLDPLGKLPRYRLLCQGDLALELVTHGCGPSQPILNDALYDVLRIEAGIPQMGSEIKHDSIPLEVGLRDTISFSKGCYIGQEIIARMQSRGKLAHTLVGVQLDEQVKPGSDLIQNNHKIGVITSCTYSPRFGWVGLASLKPASLETPAQITRTNQETNIQIHSLPFE